MELSALRSKGEEAVRAALARWHIDVGVLEQSRWVAVAGVALLWVILNVYLIVGVRSAHRHHRELQAEVAKLNKLVGDTSWHSRLQQSETLKFQVNERLWNAPTAGLAEAGFERWLREHITKEGLDPPQIQITRTPAAIQTANSSRALPGLQRMTAKVTTSFDPHAIAALAAEMAQNDKVMLLDQLIIRTQRNARMEMNVSTFVRLE
jgi:hypothetical protein